MKQKKSLVIFLLYLICSSAFINSIESIDFPFTFTQSFKKKVINSNSRVLESNGPLSFIELESQDSLSENTQTNSKLFNKIELELKEQFSTQFLNGRKRRYTEDGRLCAAAFVQEGQTFYDCTSTRSPDGQLKHREWCYVNPDQKGNVWGYCKPVMNYDKVRESNQNYLTEITAECRKVHDEIEVHLAPAENALNDLKKTRQGQAELDNKVNLLIREVETIKSNLMNLYSIKSQWESEELKVLGKLFFNHRIE